jgi:hypothetical protein
MLAGLMLRGYPGWGANIADTDAVREAIWFTGHGRGASIGARAA